MYDSRNNLKYTVKLNIYIIAGNEQHERYGWRPQHGYGRRNGRRWYGRWRHEHWHEFRHEEAGLWPGLSRLTEVGGRRHEREDGSPRSAG